MSLVVMANTCLQTSDSSPCIQEHGIQVMITGDMDLVGSMQRNWIEECGEECGMDAYLPLWKADRSTCLEQLLQEVPFAYRAFLVHLYPEIPRLGSHD